MKFFFFLVAFGIAINLNFFCYSFLFKLIVYTVLKMNTTTTTRLILKSISGLLFGSSLFRNSRTHC